MKLRKRKQKRDHRPKDFSHEKSEAMHTLAPSDSPSESGDHKTIQSPSLEEDPSSSLSPPARRSQKQRDPGGPTNQLEKKIKELEAINDELNNLLTCTDVAMIFLDAGFCIRRFTQPAEKLLHIGADDIGRPIDDLTVRINDSALLADVKLVWETRQPIEKEVCIGPRWFICRILPSRTNDKTMKGVVMVFTDISTVKEWARQVEIRERQQEAVAGLGQVALTDHDLDLLCQKLVEDVRRALDVPLVKILQLLDNRQELLLKAGVGWKSGLVGIGRVGAGKDSQAGFTLTTRGPVIVKDLHHETRFSGPPLLHDHQVVSGMSLVIGPIENPWGVLGVHAREPRIFTVDDVNFLQAVANVLYAAITNHQNQDRLRREALQASLIREAAVLAGWTDSVENALQVCMDIVCRLTGWTIAHAYVTAGAGPNLTSTKLWRLPEKEFMNEFQGLTDSMTCLIGDPSLPGRTAKEGKVCWIKNIHEDPNFLRTKYLPGVPLKGALAFPLKVENKTVAVIEFFHADEILPSPEFLETIDVLAEQFNRIFERRVALSSRERTQQRLQSIVRAAEVGTWEWDLVTDTSEWNSHMFALLGIDSSIQASVEVFFQCIHPEDRDTLRRILDDMRISGTSYNHVFRVRQPNGRIRWLTGRGEVSRDPDGKAIIFRGINIDITAIKQAQEILRESKEQLELRVAERTAVAEQRARQLRDLAFQFLDIEESARHRTARIIHDDVQQLLVALRIRFHATRDVLSSEWVENTDRLIDQGLQACRTLVLDLSPPVLREAGILSGLRWLVRQAMEKYGLSVHSELPDQDIGFDQRIKGLIFRAVQELLLNIVKHSHVKQARLAVEYLHHQLFIRIEDDGRGFNAVTLRNPGNIEKSFGFGLFTLHERVTAMGGELQIDSAPGQGTRIKIMIPIESQSLGEIPAVVEQLRDQQPEPESKSSLHDGIRVIVVDDHAALRDGIISILSRQAGIHVVGEAANGQEAIDRTRQNNPHIIVMDINMPGINGIEATRRIKEEMPHVLVIGLSMHDDHEMIQSMYNAGASEFVSKGKPLKQLVETIRRVITVALI
jgi:PAS domain S-box-containing protein